MSYLQRLFKKKQNVKKKHTINFTIQKCVCNVIAVPNPTQCIQKPWDDPWRPVVTKSVPKSGCSIIYIYIVGMYEELPIASATIGYAGCGMSDSPACSYSLLRITHIYIHMYIYIYTHIDISIYIYTYVYTCVYIHLLNTYLLNIYIIIYIYIRWIYICGEIYIYIYIYIYMKIFANLLIALWCIHTVLRTYLTAKLAS